MRYLFSCCRFTFPEKAGIGVLIPERLPHCVRRVLSSADGSSSATASSHRFGSLHTARARMSQAKWGKICVAPGKVGTLLCPGESGPRHKSGPRQSGAIAEGLMPQALWDLFPRPRYTYTLHRPNTGQTRSFGRARSSSNPRRTCHEVQVSE